MKLLSVIFHQLQLPIYTLSYNKNQLELVDQTFCIQEASALLFLVWLLYRYDEAARLDICSPVFV